MTPNSSSKRLGFTLIELLVVLSIIALVSGVSLAILSHSGRQFSFQSSCGQVVSMLRHTRINAITEKGTVATVINPTTREIYACTRRTEGLWHFEDIKGNESTGAFNKNAKLQGDAAVGPYGKYGYGLTVTSTGYAECGSFSIISADEGLAVECWISPTELTAPADRTAVNISTGAIVVNSSNGVRATYGGLTATTLPDFISSGRWSHLAMVFRPDYVLANGAGTLELYINDIQVASQTGSAGIPPGRFNINIGGPANTFDGQIDEVKVSSSIESDRLAFGPEVSFMAFNGIDYSNLIQPLAIWFDKKGNPTQPLPLLKINNTATRDSLIIEVTNSGGIKVR